MADNNMKITDAGTITSMNGTDKVFVNSGDDLKQITLDNAVANSTPVKTLSSNLGNIFGLPYYTYTQLGSDTSYQDYFKKYLIKFCESPKAFYDPYIGKLNPNALGIAFGGCYDYTMKNEEGLPKYAYFLYIGVNGAVVTFGTYEYNFYCNNIV